MSIMTYAIHDSNYLHILCIDQIMYSYDILLLNAMYVLVTLCIS